MRELNKQELDTILKNHNLWLSSSGKKGKRANLAEANLAEADLAGANLAEADLAGADLAGADLAGADLAGADLFLANLRRANLRHADLFRANLRHANLAGADLRHADLFRANLRHANLAGADLDFSTFPLWCGGLNIHIDDRQATQLLYHLVKNVKYSKNTSDYIKKLCSLKSIIKQANKFHRLKECGEIE